MEIKKLKVSDFAEERETYFLLYNDRGNSNEGESIERYIYTTRCKLLGRNVLLRFVSVNPEKRLDEYLPQLRKSLQWVENNSLAIYKAMNEKRKDCPTYNSDATTKMNDAQFVKFLRLEQVQVTVDLQNNNEFTVSLLFNEMDYSPGTHFAVDIDGRLKSINVYSRSGFTRS